MYHDLEIIIVDDGSTDETPTLSVQDDLRYLQCNHSGMPGKVRNLGALEAKGEFLAFLDSDDLWMPEKLQRQIPLMETYRISHTRERWLRNGREVSQKGQRHRREGMIFDDSLKKCVIGPSTVLLDRRLLEEQGGFREDLEIGEDYELWLRITSKHPVGYLDETLTTKRAGHGDQLTEKHGHIEFFRIGALSDLLESGGIPEDLRERAGIELARKCKIYAQGARKRGREGEARDYEALAGRYG